MTGQGRCPRPPSLALLALKKEMQGSRAKVGGSSLVKGEAKTPLGCYSGAATLGKQISPESEKRVGRPEAKQVLLVRNKHHVLKHSKDLLFCCLFFTRHYTSLTIDISLLTQPTTPVTYKVVMHLQNYQLLFQFTTSFIPFTMFTSSG